MKVARNGVTLEGCPQEVIDAMKTLGWNLDGGEAVLELAHLEKAFEAIQIQLRELKDKVDSMSIFRGIEKKKDQWDYLQPTWIVGTGSGQYPDLAPKIVCDATVEAHTKTASVENRTNTIKGDFR